MPFRLAIAFAFTLVVGCTSGATSTGISEVSCPPDSTLTYANFGQDVVTTNCMSCHDRQSPQLGSQAQIKAHEAQILDLAVYSDAMPKDHNMPVEQRQLLGEWLACGAP